TSPPAESCDPKTSSSSLLEICRGESVQSAKRTGEPNSAPMLVGVTSMKGCLRRVADCSCARAAVMPCIDAIAILLSCWTRKPLPAGGIDCEAIAVICASVAPCTIEELYASRWNISRLLVGQYG